MWSEKPIPLDAVEVALVSRHTGVRICKVDRHTPTAVYVEGRRYRRDDGRRVPAGESRYGSPHIEPVSTKHRERERREEIVSGLGLRLLRLNERLDRALRHGRQMLRDPAYRNDHQGSKPTDFVAVDFALDTLKKATLALERAFDLTPDPTEGD